MKNYQKGVIAIGLIIGIIVALFVVGGGVYYMSTKTAEAPEPEATTTPITTEDNTKNTVAVSGELAITSISPASGAVGTVVTLKGDGFVSGLTSVSISPSQSKSHSPDSVSSTEVKFTIPSDLEPGLYNVWVLIGTKHTPMSNVVTFTVTKPNSTSANWKTYTDSSFGFSLTYPDTWTLGSQVIGNYGNTLVLKQPNGDSISVAKVSGSQVKDVDAKFGDVTYYFDTGRNSWMANWNTDGKHNGLEVASPVYYTDSGLPVFLGLSRWGTAIVPLSHDKFLVVTVTGGGDKSTLAPFVKTISAK